MLKKVFSFCFLFLAACTTNNIKENEFYHSINLKPTITEMPTTTGRIVSVYNPFPKTLTITIDCEEQENRRTMVVAPNTSTSFTIETHQDFISMVCSIEHGWTLK